MCGGGFGGGGMGGLGGGGHGGGGLRGDLLGGGGLGCTCKGLGAGAKGGLRGGGLRSGRLRLGCSREVGSCNSSCFGTAELAGGWEFSTSHGVLIANACGDGVWALVAGNAARCWCSGDEEGVLRCASGGGLDFVGLGRAARLVAPLNERKVTGRGYGVTLRWRGAAVVGFLCAGRMGVMPVC